jgi:hypothetical protein
MLTGVLRTKWKWDGFVVVSCSPLVLAWALLCRACSGVSYSSLPLPSTPVHVHVTLVAERLRRLERSDDHAQLQQQVSERFL